MPASLPAVSETKQKGPETDQPYIVRTRGFDTAGTHLVKKPEHRSIERDEAFEVG